MGRSVLLASSQVARGSFLRVSEEPRLLDLGFPLPRGRALGRLHHPDDVEEDERSYHRHDDATHEAPGGDPD